MRPSGVSSVRAFRNPVFRGWISSCLWSLLSAQLQQLRHRHKAIFGVIDNCSLIKPKAWKQINNFEQSRIQEDRSAFQLCRTDCKLLWGEIAAVWNLILSATLFPAYFCFLQILKINAEALSIKACEQCYCVCSLFISDRWGNPSMHWFLFKWPSSGIS